MQEKELENDDKSENKGEEKMEKMIARCGIVCSECGAFIATKTGDEKLREKTAKEWSAMFKADIKPEDVYCDGCTQNEGYLFSHCHECEIRKCCDEKKLENCAHCDEFICDKLEGFFKYLPPNTKENMIKIHRSLFV